MNQGFQFEKFLLIQYQKTLYVDGSAKDMCDMMSSPRAESGHLLLLSCDVSGGVILLLLPSFVVFVLRYGTIPYLLENR